MELKFEFRGYKEVEAALLALDTKVRKKIVNKAIRSGLSVIKKQAKQNLQGHKRSGNLIKSISLKVKMTAGKLIGFVYLRRATKAQINKAKARAQAAGVKYETYADWWYGSILERGARPHSLKRGAYLASRKRSNSKGQVTNKLHPGFAPIPFMEPALKQRARDAISAVGDTIRSELAK